MVESGDSKGGANVTIIAAINNKEPAGPAYPPKSISDAINWENCDKNVDDDSTTVSIGTILVLVFKARAATMDGNNIIISF